MINKIQHEQYCHGLGEQQSSLNMRESSTALALEFVDAHELAQHLQEFKDLLKKVQKLGLGEEFVSSMNRSALHAGVELAMFQAVINEQNNREIRKNNDKVFQKNLKKVSPQALTTTPEMNPVEGSVVNQMPFQSAFAYILLDKYIPSQEAALYALGQELNLAGYAQTTFSPLLEIVKNFNSAPINYNLGSYISQTNGTANFKYGYEMVLSRYDEERASLRNDIKSTEQAKALLAKIKTNVSTHSSLTEAQKTQLTEIADNYLNSLDLIEEQLKSLMLNLNSIIFTRGVDEFSPSYKVVGADFSILGLQNTERVVVDGDINIETATTSGGLLNFFNTLLADVQNYGDLAQTQQMMLDLQLKAMLQQWSLVSSSLRLLDGVYRTLISGVKS